MQLKDLIAKFNYRQIVGDAGVEISGLTYDSRKVKSGDLFFCIKGFKVDGHSFACKACEMGAAAIVVEEIQPDLSVAQIVVDNTRYAMAHLSSAFFGNPTQKLKLIGITGTNGKTTTSFMVESILRSAGYKTGLIGTIEYRIIDEKIPVDRTTPESLDLQRLFAKMVDAGVEAVAMEVSSHAIDLFRTEACNFDVLVFTNLSQDHLDYHESLDEYFKVKSRVFSDTPYAIQVINADDEYGCLLIGKGKEQLRYSIKDKVELYANNILLKPDGSDVTLHIHDRSMRVSLKLPGLYNVYNALAAAGSTSALGIGDGQIKIGLESLDLVPGRFERVDCGQDFTVIVDYAHTPDSLEKVLTAARQLAKGRLLAVFGCGGDRDKSKRPLMGKVAAELSDHVIITSDNPRSEGPIKIIDEIISGIKKVGNVSYEIEEDRKVAIKKAIRMAKEGDFIVIAGKGHESGQEIAGKKIPFDDVKVAKELLGERLL